MITQEQKERYQYQQTEAGQQVMKMLEYMKTEYCRELQIPVSQIKTGKLIPLINGRTGLIDKFIEE